VGDGSVEVTPEGLMTWGATVMGNVVGAQTGLSTAYSGISEHGQAAFNSPGAKTYPFKEGSAVFSILKRNMSEFEAFVADVTTGAQAIQSASTAMAVAYATTDGGAASSLSAVDFAFADGGTLPDGFPVDKNGHVTTMSDAQAAASGQNTAAGLAATNESLLQYATSKVWAGDGYIYSFADGSMLRVTTASSGSTFISDSTKTVSVFRKGETKPASTVTTGDSYDYSGQKTTTTTRQTVGADGRVITSSESTTHLNDGSVQVTTTTTGVDGKPTTTSVNVKPAAPSEASSDAGEIDKLETKYHSTGAGGQSWM
jgi:hypothetical protein